ncbi:MAG: TonB-dependent receptor [Gemmatimonadetes bacterium]|nr:TonB-dependent receptor [Gemmatimonadota bacterium]
MRVVGRIDDLVGVARTATEGRVGAAELRFRPLTREGELLETVPGMIVTEHSGDGKANQYFVRGFNLDHGTDFQTRLEGMPLNMPTHGHGQGYTDLNFLMPELVDHIEYQLGVYIRRSGTSAAPARPSSTWRHVSRSRSWPSPPARTALRASRLDGRGAWPAAPCCSGARARRTTARDRCQKGSGS